MQLYRRAGIRCIRPLLTITTLWMLLLAGPMANHPGIQIRAQGAAFETDLRFQRAMEHYTRSEFNEAAAIFSQLQDPEARLFAGKSYFATGDYPLSKKFLRTLSAEDDPRIYNEARYTLALSSFQTGQYGNSLDLLHHIGSRPSSAALRSDARQLYDQILGFLTAEQRKEAFIQSQKPAVQIDILRYGLDYWDRNQARQIYQALYPYFKVSADTNLLAAIDRRIQGLPEHRPAGFGYGKAPEGMVYNIGILLPETQNGTREWQISRSLYNGYLLAAEQFNNSQNGKHIRLHHYTTSDETLSMEAAMARLAWKHHAHAIIGPLFSQDAYRIRELAEYYRIPLIAPLANSDTLNLQNPYVFQINPSFETRGRLMAAFAVNELRLDTLAVISQSNQPVSAEARAFRYEAERLGATVIHYFSENFEERAFEVGHITPWFAGNPQLIDEEEFPLKPVKGLYIALTGAGSDQLIDLILNDLQAFRSRVTILGNEEIAHVPLSESRRRYFDIYYSDLLYRDNTSRHNHLFQSEYRNFSGIDADRFAHLGYDVARFLFQSLDEIENPARLKNRLRYRPTYEGVITTIDFGGSNINQLMHILKIDLDQAIPYEAASEDFQEENSQGTDPVEESDNR